MKVICINDTGRPDDIPSSKWIKKDEVYHVRETIVCKGQPGHPICFVLWEIDLNGCGFYKGFNATRFIYCGDAVVIACEEEEICLK